VTGVTDTAVDRLVTAIADAVGLVARLARVVVVPVALLGLVDGALLADVVEAEGAWAFVPVAACLVPAAALLVLWGRLRKAGRDIRGLRGALDDGVRRVAGAPAVVRASADRVRSARGRWRKLGAAVRGLREVRDLDPRGNAALDGLLTTVATAPGLAAFGLVGGVVLGLALPLLVVLALLA
jgi:hypothetical protein